MFSLNRGKSEAADTFYIAYGSNLNMAQMAYRCPDALPCGSGVLRDYELLFRGHPGGAYATVEPCTGSSVPVGVWRITKRCERALDRYEGFPSLYRKQTVSVETAHGTVEGIVYIMNDIYPPAQPMQYYIDVCLDGYDDFYLNKEIFRAALRKNSGRGSR
jgi:gamma-glutamylcyclotransferase (GGCT)/AIG2-like uncharacterized protein YtfP